MSCIPIYHYHISPNYRVLKSSLSSCRSRLKPTTTRIFRINSLTNADTMPYQTFICKNGFLIALPLPVLWYSQLSNPFLVLPAPLVLHRTIHPLIPHPTILGSSPVRMIFRCPHVLLLL